MGFELDRIMKQYGLGTASVVDYSGSSPEDTAAYDAYKKEYETRLQNTPMMMQSQYQTGYEPKSAGLKSAAETIGVDQFNKNIQDWANMNPTAYSGDINAYAQKYGISGQDIFNATQNRWGNILQAPKFKIPAPTVPQVTAPTPPVPQVTAPTVRPVVPPFVPPFVPPVITPVKPTVVPPQPPVIPPELPVVPPKPPVVPPEPPPEDPEIDPNALSIRTKPIISSIPDKIDPSTIPLIIPTTPLELPEIPTITDPEKEDKSFFDDPNFVEVGPSRGLIKNQEELPEEFDKYLVPETPSVPTVTDKTGVVEINSGDTIIPETVGPNRAGGGDLPEEFDKYLAPDITTLTPSVPADDGLTGSIQDAIDSLSGQYQTPASDSYGDFGSNLGGGSNFNVGSNDLGGGFNDYSGGGFDGGFGGGGGCPAPWINIELADGSTVKAGDIKVGMEVYTRHENKDVWGVYPVTAVEMGEDQRWEVILEDGRKFVGTYNHRVYTGSDWVEIRNLNAGDKLLQKEGFGIVKSSLPADYGQIVKITVDDAHTYMTEGFLSHNMKLEDSMTFFDMYAKGGPVKTHYQTAGRVQLPSGYETPEDEADFLARQERDRVPVETSAVNMSNLPPPVILEPAAAPAAPLTAVALNAAKNASAPVVPAVAAPKPVPVAPPAFGSERMGNIQALLAAYGPKDGAYGEELKTARATAKAESDAFAKMLSDSMKNPEDAQSSKAEMYFRLAAAFGAPTKTGHFAENLGMVGKELGDYSKEQRASRQQKLALALKGQEMKMGAAKDDLRTLQALSAEEMKDKRTIATELIKDYIKSGEPQSTAGKQALDEGLKPGTPEYQKRVETLGNMNIESKLAQITASLAGVNTAAANLALAQEKFQNQKQQQTKLSPTEITMKKEAEDTIAIGKQSLADLKQAYALNPNSLAGGWMDKGQQWLAEAAGSKDPTIVNTRILNNLLGSQGLAKLKSTFGGNPTEGERAIMLELEGIGSKTKEERAAIIKRTYKVLQDKQAREQARLDQINSGAYRSTTPLDGGSE